MLKRLAPGGPLAATGHRWEPKPLKKTWQPPLYAYALPCVEDMSLEAWWIHQWPYTDPEAMPRMQVVTW